MPKKKNKGGGGGGGGGGGAEGGGQGSAAAEAAAAEIITAGATIKAESSGFRFQDGVVEDDILKDMKSLKALSTPQLTALVSMSLDFLTSTDASVLVEKAQEFANLGLLNMETSVLVEKAQELADSSEINMAALKGVLRRDMMQFGLSEAQADAVSALWHAHLQHLSRSIADHSLKVNKLVDIDWRFGVTSSSSELQQEMEKAKASMEFIS